MMTTAAMRAALGLATDEDEADLQVGIPRRACSAAAVFDVQYPAPIGTLRVLDLRDCVPKDATECSRLGGAMRPDVDGFALGLTHLTAALGHIVHSTNAKGWFVRQGLSWQHMPPSEHQLRVLLHDPADAIRHVVLPGQGWVVLLKTSKLEEVTGAREAGAVCATTLVTYKWGRCRASTITSTATDPSDIQALDLSAAGSNNAELAALIAYFRTHSLTSLHTLRLPKDTEARGRFLSAVFGPAESQRKYKSLAVLGMGALDTDHLAVVDAHFRDYQEYLRRPHQVHPDKGVSVQVVVDTGMTCMCTWTTAAQKQVRHGPDAYCTATAPGFVLVMRPATMCSGSCCAWLRGIWLPYLEPGGVPAVTDAAGS